MRDNRRIEALEQLIACAQQVQAALLHRDAAQFAASARDMEAAAGVVAALPLTSPSPLERALAATVRRLTMEHERTLATLQEPVGHLLQAAREQGGALALDCRV